MTIQQQTEYYPYNLISAIFGADKDISAINKEAFEANLGRVATYAQVSDRDVETLIWRFRDGLSYQSMAKRYNNTITRQALQMAQRTALEKLNREEYFNEFSKDKDFQPIFRCGNVNTDSGNAIEDTPVSAFNISNKTKLSLRQAGYITIGDLAKLNVRDITDLPHVHWRNSESVFAVLKELGIARPSPEIIAGLKTFMKKYKMSYSNLSETVKYLIAESENQSSETPESKGGDAQL